MFSVNSNLQSISSRFWIACTRQFCRKHCQLYTSSRSAGHNADAYTCSMLHKNVTKLRTRNLHLTRSVNCDSTSKGFKDHALKVAIYGSFITGGIILSAVALRKLKDLKRKWNGVEFLKIPEWGRVRLFKYKGYILPELVVNVLDDIEKFGTSAEDVWIVSYPRSGSTWLQEIVYLIHSDMDIATASSKHLDDRWAYLEFMYPGIREVQNMQPPRLIKSHLPYTLLPDSVKEKKPKIIYIARNPKDVVVSYFYFTRLLFPVTRYKGDFPEFFKLFMNDHVMYSPWSNHVVQFWDRRHEENILFLTYEDLKKDTAGTVDKIAGFLGKSITTDQKRQIIQLCSFENMKLNPQTNYRWFNTWGVSTPKEGDFMRKGCIGDWANHLTEAMNWEMNNMMTHRFANSDITFSFSGVHYTSQDSEHADNEK